MPVLDHFHPPLSSTRHWESFHSRWAAAIADSLNSDLLPPDYFAEVQVHVGSRVEIDVATFDSEGAVPVPSSQQATATATAPAWAPPAPQMVMPALFPDSLEVLVLSQEAGPTLVAAVELVSPGNKDRPEYRRAFAAKCASYLQQGIGLVIVDIVTSRPANLHNELVRLLECDEQFLLPADSLYAVAYRPLRRDESDDIDVWSKRLAVGLPLCELPLALDKGLAVPLDLNATYTEACQRSRIE